MTIEHLAIETLSIITGFLLVSAAIEKFFKKKKEKACTPQ